MMEQDCTFDEYRCKDCWYYDHCFQNEVAVEVEADNLYRAMQGEPLEKIFGGTYNANALERTTGDIPF